jgi:hypothetical protein
MKKLWMVLGLALALVGCAEKDPLDMPTGTDVTLEKTDGVTVAGRLVEVKPEQVVVESRDGVKTRVARSQIASMRKSSTPAAADERAARGVPALEAPAAPRTPEPAERTAATSGSEAMPADLPANARTPAADAQSAISRMQERKPEYREVTLPAGTALTVELTSAVASDTSHVEDQVRGTLRNAVRMDGLEALSAGTVVLGHVTSAEPSAKVKGRASVGFRFNTIDLPGDGAARESISTATYRRVAAATKKKDATKIGIGAGAGAVIGGILGGGSGAAKGAAIGGGAGTAVVLSTKGDEVRIPAGTRVTIKLTAPLTVRVQVKS